MNVILKPERGQWPEILSRPEKDDTKLKEQVSTILDKVRKEGDRSVISLTSQFDGISLDRLEVSQEEQFEASTQVSEVLKRSLDVARQNIEQFHSIQKADSRVIYTTPGVKCWLKSLPIERVGLYIPGGSAPLISTVLMLGIPARLAGCKEIILCTPPDKEGKVHPAILYAAGMLGIDRIFRIGGAQAIAAMAYGTESIPGCDKIFGPGNQYVTLAKQLVSLEGTAIDLPAGPSEVAIMADETADPEFIAADLLSQAEHGSDSQVLLVCQDQPLIDRVQQALEKQLADLPRKDIAAKALENSRIVYLPDREEMLEMINAYAPEHLIIMCNEYLELGNRVKHAGSVFLGPYTPESAGDYASGTNHTLPTNGYARAYSGLGLMDFMKRISFQEINEYGLYHLGPDIMNLAREEQLSGHSNAVKLRLDRVKDQLMND